LKTFTHQKKKETQTKVYFILYRNESLCMHYHYIYIYIYIYL
jgi:hypothetical protein